MSLQYVEQTSVGYPPLAIFARGGGNQKPGKQGTGNSAEGAGKPTKKAAKKAATKKKK